MPCRQEGDGFLSEYAELASERGRGGGGGLDGVHPDLSAERQAATFDARSLTYVIYGGKRATEHRERIAALIESDDVFDNSENIFLHRTERYHRALAKAIRLRPAYRPPFCAWCLRAVTAVARARSAASRAVR